MVDGTYFINILNLKATILSGDFLVSSWGFGTEVTIWSDKGDAQAASSGPLHWAFSFQKGLSPMVS